MNIWSTNTPRGQSRSGHGISWVYNQSPEGRRNKEASNRRNKENQRALAAWHNESRGKPNEVPFPARKAA
jgi:hypothetical protein